MKVNYIYRSKKCKRFSIENVFDTVIPYVQQNGIEVVKSYVPENRARITAMLRNLTFTSKLTGDIFHVTGDVHYILASLLRKKTVLTVHDIVSLENSKGLKKALLKLLWFRIPIFLANHITVISKKTYDDIVSMFPEYQKKISIIPDSVSNEFSYFCREINLTSPTILQMGTKDNKNLYNVIDALIGLKCTLNIIGDLSNEQIEYIKRSGICFKNKSNLSNEEIIEEYKNCDLLVFASTFEGFGLPILEAQATGRPVITSNIEPMCSVAGNGALLVNPYSAKDIRQAIDLLFSDNNLASKLVKEGLDNVKFYRADKIAEMYIEIYQNII